MPMGKMLREQMWSGRRAKMKFEKPAGLAER
jgi:hypothetical protein